MDIDMPLADIAKKLKKDSKKNKKGPKPGKKGSNNKQGNKQGSGSNKGTPNKVKGGVGKVLTSAFHVQNLESFCLPFCF
jgi:hypothetical protein